MARVHKQQNTRGRREFLSSPKSFCKLLALCVQELIDSALITPFSGLEECCVNLKLFDIEPKTSVVSPKPSAAIMLMKCHPRSNFFRSSANGLGALVISPFFLECTSQLDHWPGQGMTITTID